MDVYLPLGVILVLCLFGGIYAVRTTNARRESERLAQAEESESPPVTEADQIMRQLLAMEARSKARYADLKSRIFWTPLIWAVIGAVLWQLAFVILR